MSVKRAQEEIDSYEFSEWCVFNNIDPSGETRADIRTALIRRTLYEINSTKNAKIPDIKDLMIDFQKVSKKSVSETVSAFENYLNTRYEYQEKKRNK
jgi:hypothetical protein